MFAVVITVVLAPSASAATEGSPISTIGAPTTSVAVTVPPATPLSERLSVPADVDTTIDPVVTTTDLEGVVVVGGAFTSDGTGYDLQIVNPDPSLDAQGALRATWSGIRFHEQFEPGSGQQLRVPTPSGVDTSVIPTVTPDDSIDITIDQVAFSSDGSELVVTLSNTSEVPVSTYYSIGWVTTLAVTAEHNPGIRVSIPAPPGNIVSEVPQISLDASPSLELTQAEYDGAETNLLVGVANTDPEVASSGSVDVVFTAPYAATSPTVSVNPGSYTDPIGYSCADGYDAASQPVQTHGDYIKQWDFAHLLPFTGSDGKSYYNAFQVSYFNESLISSHDAWVTWECVPQIMDVAETPPAGPPVGGPVEAGPGANPPVEVDPGVTTPPTAAELAATGLPREAVAPGALGGAALVLTGALLLWARQRRRSTVG
jgi:hypothetical protein